MPTPSAYPTTFYKAVERLRKIDVKVIWKLKTRVCDGGRAASDLVARGQTLV